MDTQKEVATLLGHSRSVNSVAFSPDGKYLASGSGDSTVKLWSIDNYKEVVIKQGRSRWVTSVAFSADGKYLASGSYEKTVKLWRMDDL